jgi:hypothetical protein
LTVDSDIIEILETVIQTDLAAPKVPKERLPKLRKVWKCDSAYDFLYGNRVGYYAGLAEGFMLERHKRNLTEQESEEIFQLIERYTKKIRRYFSYYKRKKPSA